LNTNVMINDLTDYQALLSGNSPNIFTAMGNNYAMIRSPWWSQMEGAANVIPLYRLAEQGFKDGLTNRMSDIFTQQNEGINQLFPLALEYAAVDSAKWLRSDAGTNYNAFALLPIIQLAYYNDDNWTFYEHLNTKIKQNPLSSGLNFFFTELCAYFGKDFSPFFDHWGIDLSDATRAVGRNYPLIDKTIWLYNPLSSNPNANVVPFNTTSYRYSHIRSNWDIRAFDVNY